MNPEIKSLKVLGTKEAFQMIVKMSSFYQKKQQKQFSCINFQYFNKYSVSKFCHYT